MTFSPSLISLCLWLPSALYAGDWDCIEYCVIKGMIEAFVVVPSGTISALSTRKIKLLAQLRSKLRVRSERIYVGGGM